jgi:hypothetical protein
MKTNKHIIFLLYISIFFCFCNGKSKIHPEKTNASESVIDTIPVEYKGRLFASGIINDSIPLKVAFDTGVAELILPDYIKSRLNEKDSVRLKIGSFKIAFAKASFTKENNSAILGWKYFKNKIMEISYKGSYINVLESLPNVAGYDCIDYKIKGHLLVAPVKVNIEGYSLTINDVAIDTGLNESLIFKQDEAPGLNYKCAKKGIVYTLYGKEDLFVFTSDTICLGESYISNKKVATGNQRMFKVFSSCNGMIGNRFFENFSVIFDFPNQRMYLKPIEQI